MPLSTNGHPNKHRSTGSKKKTTLGGILRSLIAGLKKKRSPDLFTGPYID
jgi:hypothetical protein